MPFDSEGRIIRGGGSSDASGGTGSSEETITYSAPANPVVGAVFACIFAAALIIGLINSGIEGLAQIPNRVFGGDGWIYWFAVGLTIIITTITLFVKEDLFNSVMGFFSIIIANATALLGAHLIEKLLMPILRSWTPGGRPDVGMGMRIFSLDGTIRQILLYSPHIILIAVFLSSFIFVISRYSNKNEITPVDLLWQFLCSIVVAVVLLLIIGAVISIVWVALYMLFVVLILIALGMAAFCYCC